MEKSKRFKKNFIWNIIGTSFNSFNSLFFLIIVTRINGVNEAGIFSLAFSTACILFIVGTYAGRIYQVTEVNEKITDKEYILNRIISCFTMMLISIIFVFFKKYDAYKKSIFILLSMYKLLEAFSDVLYGIFQKNDRLEIVGKSYFIKSIVSLISFMIINIITKNMILSCIALIITWVIIIILYDFKKAKEFIDLREKINFHNVIKIFKDGFFIFSILFMGLYLLNEPKYAIDKFLTEDIQAIFGIIIMPATVMGLIGQFLIHPYLGEIKQYHKEKKMKELKKVIKKINLFILIIGMLASIVAYFIGIEVLELIYNINLQEFKVNLVLIIIAATFYNIAMVYSSLLTTIRCTFEQFNIYLSIVIITYFLSNELTRRYQINGATLAYFIAMLMFFIIYFIVTKIKLNKKEKI